VSPSPQFVHPLHFGTTCVCTCAQSPLDSFFIRVPSHAGGITESGERRSHTRSVLAFTIGF
jgi:hypothetical protein